MTGHRWSASATATWWLTAATVLWALALPLAAAHEVLPSSVGLAVYRVGQVVCHQRPERSFHWAGHAWPVCARCAGIYAGAAIGMLLAFRISLSAVVRTPTRVRRYLCIAVAPAVASLLFEWVTGIVPANAVRAVTGVAAGGVAALLLAAFVREEVGRLGDTTVREPEVN